MARLLFVNHTWFGGAARSFLKLHKYLKFDHQLTVAVPREGPLTRRLEQEGISWRIFPFRFRHIPVLMRLIQRGGFDLVYGNNFSNPAFKALIATRLLGKPFVWHIREVLETDKAHRLRYATVIIANSQAAADSVKRYTPHREVKVIPNGIDLEDFSVDRDKAKRHIHSVLDIPDESVIVINAGRVCDQKNQLHAVEAAAHVTKVHSSIVFVFLGDFQEEGYLTRLRERAAQLRIQDNIRLTGFQSDVGGYFCGADILIHTSRQESQGRVFLEAMAARLPVVAYDVGGIRESVVAGETGFLVPFGDVNGLAQSLAQLVSDAALRKQMGERGYQRVSQLFTAERTAQQVNAVIESTLRR